jgi:hypothetical protein
LVLDIPRSVIYLSTLCLSAFSICFKGAAC